MNTDLPDSELQVFTAIFFFQVAWVEITEEVCDPLQPYYHKVSTEIKPKKGCAKLPQDSHTEQDFQI